MERFREDEPDLDGLLLDEEESDVDNRVLLRESYIGSLSSIDRLVQLAERYRFREQDVYDHFHNAEYTVPYAIVKISGSCLTKRLAHDIADLSYILPLAVIVGGGEEITQRCKDLGLPIEREGPWRVTTKEVLDVVNEVMTDMTTNFAGMIREYGGNARELIGTHHQPLIFADKAGKREINGQLVDLEYFGVIPEQKEDLYLTNDLLQAIQGTNEYTVPVVAALGHQRYATQPEEGYQTLNIDGDEVMRLIAHKASPQKFVWVTNRNLKVLKNGRMRIPRKFYDTDFKRLMKDGQIDESLALKLSAGFKIEREYGGTRSVTYLKGNQVVPNLLNTKQVGTTLYLSAPKTS